MLSRIEDEQTGRLLVPELFCDIPPQRLTQQQSCAKALGNHIYEEFSFVSGSGPVSKDLGELLINRTWKPSLVVTGMSWE